MKVTFLAFSITAVIILILYLSTAISSENSIVNTLGIAKGRCGNGICETKETCESCPRDCLKAGQVCCNKIPYYGNCCDNSQCSSSQICQSHQCINICTPTTCSALGKNCGSWPNGCDGTLNCGSCSENQICNNGVCITPCTSTTCASLGKNCGTWDDGCGGNLNCGSCSENQICNNGICQQCFCTDADLNKDNVVDYKDLAMCGASNNTSFCNACINSEYGNICVTNICSDTDGGINYYVKGTVSGYYNGGSYNYTDYCLNNTILSEFYCHGLPEPNDHSGGFYYLNTIVACPYNATTNTTKYCINGACV